MAINIRESFNKDVIEETDADIDETEERELLEVFEEVWEGPIDPSTVNLAALAFVAGRAFGSANSEIPSEFSIKMRTEVLEKFIEFLVDGQ